MMPDDPGPDGPPVASHGDGPASPVPPPDVPSLRGCLQQCLVSLCADADGPPPVASHGDEPPPVARVELWRRVGVLVAVEDCEKIIGDGPPVSPVPPPDVPSLRGCLQQCLVSLVADEDGASPLPPLPKSHKS